MACVEGALKTSLSWLMAVSILAVHIRTFPGLLLPWGNGDSVPGRKSGVKTGESPRIMGNVCSCKLNEWWKNVLDHIPGTLEGSAVLAGLMA